MTSCYIETSAGRFLAEFAANGLARLLFPEPNAPEDKATTGPLDRRVKAWAEQTRQAVEAVLRAEKPKLPPLDLECGTDFQRQVWGVLQSIEPGATLTYAEVGAKIGRPRGARAVGQACGANPIPVLIPCHRVLAANRKIGGFSGGMEWKRKLLAGEGVLAR
jgi:O-6-methylguanine DNA methyltransferase